MRRTLVTAKRELDSLDHRTTGEAAISPASFSAPAFCSRPVRLDALDLGRGLSVLVMIAVHTLWLYGDVKTQTASSLGAALHLLGKGTAAFLVAMGISFMLSRDQTVLGAVKRGGSLLALGYLMNGLKFLVPIFAGTMPESFIHAYSWSSPLNARQLLYLLATGDILQLAGVSLLFMGLFRRAVTDGCWLMIVAVLCACLSHVVRGLRVGVGGLDYLCDLLWGTEYNVYFPVFPWITCIIAGMALGADFRAAGGNEALLYRRMLRYGVIFLAVGIGLLGYDWEVHFRDFFHLGAGGILYLVGLNLLGLRLLHELSRRFSCTAVANLLRYCSVRVTTLYVIQWTLLCWGMGVVGYQTLGRRGVILLIGVALTVTLLVQRGLDLLRSPPLGRARAQI